MHINPLSNISYRWYQTEAITSIWNYFNNGGKGNPLIALPTGTGKTLVIGGFIYSVLTNYANQKIVVLTHVKELVEQNYKKLIEIWPSAPVGINNSAIGQRDTQSPCIIGSIQSVAKNAHEFGKVDLIIVDECHRINYKDNSQYKQFIDQCQKTNPFVKVIGLSATIYRQGIGYITNDELFTDVIYNGTTTKYFKRFIDEGFLSPLHIPKTDFIYDTSQVKLVAGEYNLKQLQETVNVSDKLFTAIKENVERGQNYRSWLIFASGIEHAENIARILNECGIKAAALHNKTKKKDRDAIINAHRNGELRALVNKDILTTGYDNPQIDLIGMYRPTRSTSLWVQMLGRGTRVSPDTGKTHCLVLDFAGNTPRLGPIDDPVIPRPRGAKEAGDAPVKVCGECGMYNHAAARECYFCGVQFPIREKIEAKAGKQTVMSFIQSEPPKVELFNVDQIYYYKHTKKYPPSMRVSYRCGMTFFQEWVAVESSRGRGLAKKWWSERTTVDLPETVDEALELTEYLDKPKLLRVWINKKPYPEILKAEF